MRPPTNKELETLPVVTLTSDVEWDPRCLDDEHDMNVFNPNLVYDVDDIPRASSRASDTGEGMQRIIARALIERLDGDLDDGQDVSVLDREDTLDLLSSAKYLEGNQCSTSYNIFVATC
jgi:hypothetical protein